MTRYQVLKHKLYSITSRLKNNRKITSAFLIKSAILLLLGIIISIITFRLEVNAHVYLRPWIYQPPALIIEPLSSCFQIHNEIHAQNKVYNENFVPGIPLWEEDTCYQYASLLKPRSDMVDSMFYHTYWSARSFGDNQLATLRSFLATQNRNTSLIIWILPDEETTLTSSSAWTSIQNEAPRIAYKLAIPDQLVVDTPVAPYISQYKSFRKSKQLQDTLLKMLVLYHYGGVWFDMNTLFVRDLSPLLEHEWMAQGDCFTSMFGNPFTGGLFHFHVKSPYVCELLTGATDVFIQNEPDDSKEVFGSALYYRIYRRLLHHKIHPWSILPWCYTSPQCRKSNSLPSLFAHVPVDRKKVEAIFAYHSKEQWTLSPGSLFQYIDNAHKNHTLDT